MLEIQVVYGVAKRSDFWQRSIPQIIWSLRRIIGVAIDYISSSFAIAALVAWLVYMSMSIRDTQYMLKTSVRELNNQISELKCENAELLERIRVQEQQLAEHTSRIDTRIDTVKEMLETEIDAVAETFCDTNTQMFAIEQKMVPKTQMEAVISNMTAKISAVSKKVMRLNETLDARLSTMDESLATKTYVDFRVRKLGEKCYEMFYRLHLGEMAFYHPQNTSSRAVEIVYKLNQTFYNMKHPDGPFNPSDPLPNLALNSTHDIYLD